MSIGKKYAEIKERKDKAAITCGRKPDDVLLLAVTKTHTAEEINEAIDAGATDIGENRVQELLEKYDDVKPVNWHLIGHLQTNKVKYIIDKVVMIHSVDSLHLAKEIDKRAYKAGINMDILVEVNIGMEDSKSGVKPQDAIKLVKEIVTECENITVRGIMCIPPVGKTAEETRMYFKKAANIFEKIKKLDLPTGKATIDTLSMGMSGDFEMAVEEGSTIVRVGTAIFGARTYK